MQYGIVINRDGFIVDRCVILDDENRPQYYELQEGEQVIPFDENNNFTEYIKQKWNKNEWIEGATQEEIDEYNANLPDPQHESVLSLEQRLQQLEALTVNNTTNQIENQIMKGEYHGLF